MATTALILHRVGDYAAWREVYDSVDDLRNQSGVTAAEVLKPTDGKDLVAVTHDFASASDARAFLDNEELKAVMQRAGVDLGSLEVHLFERD